jgi:hypothetical protein
MNYIGLAATIDQSSAHATERKYTTSPQTSEPVNKSSDEKERSPA